jgi:hypothetical protein
VAPPTSKIDCPHCLTNHERFAKCADGVRRTIGGRKKQAPKEPSVEAAEPILPLSPSLDAPPLSTVAQVEPPPTPEPVPEPTPEPTPEDPRASLRRMADALPTESGERRALENLLARDEAREKHQTDEHALQEATGNADARLPLPTILRDASESKGRALNAELDRVLNYARQAQDPRARPPREEVMQTKEALAALPAKREEAAREFERTHAFLGGDQRWICREPGCGNVFRSGTMAEVRRKAAEEPSWKFVDPKCLSQRVEMLDISAVA